MQTRRTLENRIYNRNCAPAQIPKPKYYIKDQTNIDSKNFPQGNCYSLILNRMFAQLIKYCCGLSKIPGSPCQAELHSPPCYHGLQSRTAIPLHLAPHLAVGLTLGVGFGDKEAIHLSCTDEREWTFGARDPVCLSPQIRSVITSRKSTGCVCYHLLTSWKRVKV